VDDHEQIGRRLERRHADAPDVLGQARLGDGDAVLHQHLRLVEIGAELERDGQHHLAVGGGLRGHVEHVLDAVDLLLDRRRHRVGDDLGRRARIRRAHDDGRRHDVWVLRHGQRAIRNGADDDRHDGDHRGKDRPVDEEPRHDQARFGVGVAGAGIGGGGVTAGIGVAGVSAITASCGSTSASGRARCTPLTMIRSSAESPLADDAQAVDQRPRMTGR
jgi:hypothetical protein